MLVAPICKHFIFFLIHVSPKATSFLPLSLITEETFWSNVITKTSSKLKILLNMQVSMFGREGEGGADKGSTFAYLCGPLSVIGARPFDNPLTS